MKTLLIGAALLLLSGCATVGSENLNMATLDAAAVMTKAEMVAQYGVPQVHTRQITSGGTTETLTWARAHVEMNPLLWVPIVGLFVAASGDGMTTEHDTLSVTFDEAGKIVALVSGSGGVGGVRR